MSLRSKAVSAGLKLPPQGTPSTTSRNASNSFNPQNSGTELAGPESPPGAISTPTASPSALRRSRTPLDLSSSPENTSIAEGTFTASSGNRVTVTSTVSCTAGTVWLSPFGGEEGLEGCAVAGVIPRIRAATTKRPKSAMIFIPTTLRNLHDYYQK